jgi:hypothetical protein
MPSHDSFLNISPDESHHLYCGMLHNILAQAVSGPLLILLALYYVDQILA